MQPPHSFRRMVLWCGLSLLSCSLDGKGLGSGQTTPDAAPSEDAAASSGGRPGTGGGPVAGTGGAVFATGGATATGTGGAPLATGGTVGGGTGGDSATGGSTGSGGVPEPGTGGAVQPGSGGAASGGAPQPGTGGHVATGGAPQPGSGGRVGTGGAGTGGAGTGGAGTGGAFATCSALTCPTGCCQNGVCVTLNRTDQRCGSGGVACAPCGACSRCSAMGTCTAEESARWNVTCVSAVVAATKNGAAWDPATPLSPLPDPYCRLTVDGDIRGTTDIESETLSPMWNQSVSGGNSGANLTTAALTGPMSRWEISVIDSDGAVDDPICSVSGRLTAADLAAGTVTFSNKENCSSLTIKVTCAQAN